MQSILLKRAKEKKKLKGEAKNLANIDITTLRNLYQQKDLENQKLTRELAHSRALIEEMRQGRVKNPFEGKLFTEEEREINDGGDGLVRYG